MKNLVFISLLMLTLGLASLSLAQSPASIDSLMYHAYLSNSQELWKEAVEQASGAIQLNTNEEALLQLAKARFGLMSSTLAKQDEALFDSHYEATVEQLLSMQNKYSSQAEAFALLSAVYDFKMAYSPWQGVLLGPKSSRLIEKGKKLEPESPLVWKIYADAKQHTPEMFGGDIEEAIESYKRALRLFESNPETLQNNWLYLDTLAWLGQAYQRKGNKALAMATYEKALAVEPDFRWVRRVLLPKALSLN